MSLADKNFFCKTLELITKYVRYRLPKEAFSKHLISLGIRCVILYIEDVMVIKHNLQAKFYSPS